MSSDIYSVTEQMTNLENLVYQGSQESSHNPFAGQQTRLASHLELSDLENRMINNVFSLEERIKILEAEMNRDKRKRSKKRNEND